MQVKQVVTFFLINIFLLGNANIGKADNEKIDFHEFEQWYKLLEYGLSPNGEWGMWRIQYAQYVDTLHIRNIQFGKEYKFASASMAEFSKNSNWLAFSMPGDKSNVGGIAYQTCLLDLHSGEKKIFDGVESFLFTYDSRYLVLKGRSDKRQELGLYDLKSRQVKNIANISGYAFDPTCRYIAYLMHRGESDECYLEIMDLSNYSVVLPKIEQAKYENLKWTKWGLTVAKAETDSLNNIRRTDIKLMNINSKEVVQYSLAEILSESLSRDMTISKYYNPHWSANGEILFFGIVPSQQMNTRPNNSAMIWHWKDKEVQSRQKNRYYENRNKALLCAWWPEKRMWKQIVDSVITDVASISTNGEYVLAVDDKPYQPHFREAHRDWYLINLQTGERTLLLENTILSLYFSREGKYVYYFKDKNWWAYDIANKHYLNLTEDLAVNLEDIYYDGPIDIAPSFGAVGWLKGDKEFCFYDEYDIWSVDMSSLKTKRLSNGRDKKMTFRFMKKGDLDLDGDVLLSVKGYDGKAGVFKYNAKGCHHPIVYGDYSYSRFIKANNTDCYLFAQEDNITSPELFYYKMNSSFVKSIFKTQIAGKDELKLKKSELIRYRNSSGAILKGALYYPVNYQEGKQYPMIVHVYETLSHNLNSFTYPSAQEAYNVMNYILQGYVVLQPDIRYVTNHPGESAVDCITEAVRQVVKKGFVDSTRIGLIGHSWGGYQAAYVISQTPMFAAAVAGAPLTNMISMYNSIYWEDGRSNQEMFETGQARLRLPWWEIYDDYMKNSPVFQAEKIMTPLLMIFGTKDNAVDWRQGLELYITMRRMGKPCILLSYEGEGHTISLLENELDQTIKIMEYFNYYLKNKNNITWILEGKKY